MDQTPPDSDATALQSSMEQQPSGTPFEVTAETSELTTPAAAEEINLSPESPPMSPLSEMEVSIDHGERQVEAATGILA